jgi:hypothetical protein
MSAAASSDSESSESDSDSEAATARLVQRINNMQARIGEQTTPSLSGPDAENSAAQQEVSAQSEDAAGQTTASEPLCNKFQWATPLNFLVDVLETHREQFPVDLIRDDLVEGSDEGRHLSLIEDVQRGHDAFLTYNYWFRFQGDRSMFLATNDGASAALSLENVPGPVGDSVVADRWRRISPPDATATVVMDSERGHDADPLLSHVQLWKTDDLGRSSEEAVLFDSIRVPHAGSNAKDQDDKERSASEEIRFACFRKSLFLQVLAAHVAP